MFDLILLDRDGVLNADREDFIKSPDEWQPLPGSAEAVAAMNRAGVKVALCTNQSGIAREYFDLNVLADIHRKMASHLAAHGAHLDEIYFCPHGPNEGCTCRKPEPGLLQRAMTTFGVPADRTCFVGDSTRDLQAAVNAGCQPVLVRSGNGRKTEAELSALTVSTQTAGGTTGNSSIVPALTSTPTFDDLAASVDYLLQGQSGHE